MSMEMEVAAARLTEVKGSELGRAIVLRRVKSVEMEPVILKGYESPPNVLMRYRGPDTFSHFIVRLRLGRLARLRTWRMRRGELALELWTPDTQEDWIHWVFPATTWEGTEARTQYSLFGFDPADDPVPDGRPINEWAWFRTKKGPPA